MAASLLLDSNIVVMLDQHSPRLRADLIDQIRTCPQVYVSAVTAWELSIKQSIGKLTLTKRVSDHIKDNNLTELPISIEHGEAVRALPLIHGDPFDRLLIAQAMVERFVLVTTDRLIARYGVSVILA